MAAAFIIISAIGRLIDLQMPEQLGLGRRSRCWPRSSTAPGRPGCSTGPGAASAPTLVADAKHLATDVVTSAAVLVGGGRCW